MCRRASNLRCPFVCLCVCLCVCHKMCMFRNGFCSFALCICTIFDQNAQKTKDANPIVQMMHHHLHDLSKHCSKHVNMHYFCMYTTREIQKPVSKTGKCRLCRCWADDASLLQISCCSNSLHCFLFEFLHKRHFGQPCFAGFF